MEYLFSTDRLPCWPASRLHGLCIPSIRRSWVLWLRVFVMCKLPCLRVVLFETRYARNKVASEIELCGTQDQDVSGLHLVDIWIGLPDVNSATHGPLGVVAACTICLWRGHRKPVAKVLWVFRRSYEWSGECLLAIIVVPHLPRSSEVMMLL